jgi:hypothetical protein
MFADGLRILQVIEVEKRAIERDDLARRKIEDV